MLNQIVFPVLVRGKNNNLEYVNNGKQFQFATKLAVQEKRLKGCHIYDSNENCFLIVDMIEVRKANPWWKFEFFNPLMEFQLSITKENLSLQTVKEDIIISIKSFKQYWEDREDVRIISENIKNLKSLSAIINYIKHLRGGIGEHTPPHSS